MLEMRTPAFPSPLRFAVVVAAAALQLGCQNGSGSASTVAASGPDRLSDRARYAMLPRRSEVVLDTTGVGNLAWSSDGRLLAAIGTVTDLASPLTFGHVVHVIDVASQRVVRTLKTTSGARRLDAGGIAFSPDGNYLAAGAASITIWDTRSWQAVREIKGPYDGGSAAGLKDLIFSPDGKSLSASYLSAHGPENHSSGGSSARLLGHDSIFIFGLADGPSTRTIMPAQPTERPVFISSGLAYAGGGEFLVSADYSTGPDATFGESPRLGKLSNHVRFWRREDGRLARAISDAHVMKVTAFGLSRSGTRIATGTNTLAREGMKSLATGEWTVIDNRDPIRVWTIDSSELVAEYGPLSGAVRSLAFVHDDRLIVSCQTDKTNRQTVWLWDADSRQVLDRFETPKSGTEIRDCKVSPGEELVAASVLERVYFFRLPR